MTKTKWELTYGTPCSMILYIRRLYFIDTGPYLQPGETGAIIVSGGQIISNKGANVENLATVEVLFEDGRRWCTLPSLPYSRHE